MMTPTLVSSLEVGRCSMPAPASTSPVRILLVEDDPDHAALMLHALSKGKFPVVVEVVENGEDALFFLRRIGAFMNAPSVELVLLDLHLPRLTGQEVLAEIKEDPQLRRIPVIVLTGLDGDEELVQTIHGLHANCFVSKPRSLDEFAQVIKRIETFWCGPVKRPRGQ
jgi:two-component system, chemotaxis family, response regulator Rcp1